MLKVVVGIFFLCFFGLVFGQSCSTLQSCSSCVAAENCGWCGPTQQCLSGDQYGPSNSTCIGSSWQWLNCTNCASLPNCRACLDFQADCFWCAKANQTAYCAQIGKVLGCPYTRSCACESYPDCSSCLYESRGDCLWCSADKTCRLKNDGSCGLSNACPCSDNQDCSSCKTTAGCFWCLKDGTCKPTSDSANCPIPFLGCDAYCKQGGAVGCSVCTSLRGCAWCPSINECHDVDYASCEIASSCPKDCTPYTSCDTCLATRGCGWCSDQRTCTNIDGSSCPLAPSCSSQVVRSTGFSGSSFVGGMFLVIGILILAMIGYFVYRYKVNARGTYTELK